MPGAQRKPPTVAEMMVATGLFEGVQERTHSERQTLPAATVLGVERTRATFLSYDEATQASFFEDLAAALAGASAVSASIETKATIGRVRK